MYDILQLNEMIVPELQAIAAELEIPRAKRLNKQDLIYKILDQQAVKGDVSEKKEDSTPKKKRTRKKVTPTKETKAKKPEN